MSSKFTVTLELPPELYERILEEALHTEKTIETVLLESFQLLFSTHPTKDEPELDDCAPDQIA